MKSLVIYVHEKPMNQIKIYWQKGHMATNICKMYNNAIKTVLNSIKINSNPVQKIAAEMTRLVQI